MNIGECLHCWKDFHNQHDLHAGVVEKEDSYGHPKLVGHAPLLCSNVISIFLTFPNMSVQAEVIGERINQGRDYGLEIPVSYHFYGHEKFVNWPKNRLEVIDKNLEKDINTI